MDRARPRATGLVAWMLAATLLLDRLFAMSGLERRMLDQVGPDRFTFWPNMIFVYVSGLLWIALFALLWPLIQDTPGRRWMQAGLVCWLIAQVSGAIGSVLALRLTLQWLLSWSYFAPSVASAGFAICFALAVRRCGLFPSWVSAVAFGWAGLSAFGAVFGKLKVVLSGPGVDLSQGFDLFRGSASLALLIAMLVGIGLRLLPPSRAQATAGA